MTKKIKEIMEQKVEVKVDFKEDKENNDTFVYVRGKEELEKFIKDKFQKDKEVCGFIFDNGEIVQIPNISGSENIEYVMSPVEQVEAITEHGSWKIIWHTHPNNLAIPSVVDLHYSFVGVYYLIYSGVNQEFRIYLREEDGFKELKW